MPPKEWLFNVIWLHDNHYHHYALEYFDSISNCFYIFARMRTTNVTYICTYMQVIWYYSMPKCIDHENLPRHLSSVFIFFIFYYCTLSLVPFSISLPLLHSVTWFSQPNEFYCVNKYAWCAFVCNMCIIVYVIHFSFLILSVFLHSCFHFLTMIL